MLTKPFDARKVPKPVLRKMRRQAIAAGVIESLCLLGLAVTFVSAMTSAVLG